jgi:hypothetical protein
MKLRRIREMKNRSENEEKMSLLGRLCLKIRESEGGM